MPELDININNTSYQLTCDDGQDKHLLKVASDLDERVKLLAQAVPKATQSWLLVTTGLLLLDEITELKNQLENQQQQDNSQHAQSQQEFLNALDSRLDRIIALLASGEQEKTVE